MRYWIFKAKPQEYDIDGRMRDPEPAITWRVEQHENEIRKGDLVFVWRTGEERGVVGVFDIDSDPHLMDEIESEQTYHRRRITERQYRITGRLRSNRPICISYLALQHIQETADLSVFMGNENSEFTKATNFVVTHRQGERLLSLAEAEAILR